MRKPDFFIVGAPKSGTSAMYDYLKQHPQVFMPELKEPHFFGADHHRINHRPRTMEQYLALFAAAGSEQRVGEASTSYLHSELAAGEIKQFSPRARILIMLRNPVEVMYSYHSTNLAEGFETIPDFEKALVAEEKRRRGLRVPAVNSGILENLFYRDVVRYARQVEKYLHAFGAENVLVLIYDDFKRGPAGVYRDTLRFLGVDPTFQPEFRVVNPNRRVRSPRLHAFIHNPPELIRRLRRAVIPDGGITDGIARRLHHLNLRHATRPPMKPELKKRLKSELAPEIQQLSQLLGRDLSHWCSP